MGTGNDTREHDPFAAILRGEEPGSIVARDDEQRFALIASLEPEAAVHWLAVPFETGYSTEEMYHEHGERFLALMDFAIAETKARVEEHPELANGFTVKFHCGSYETVPHAKLHILSKE
jgi:histidine triad (HIT) family protein